MLVLSNEHIAEYQEPMAVFSAECSVKAHTIPLSCLCSLRLEVRGERAHKVWGPKVATKADWESPPPPPDLSCSETKLPGPVMRGASAQRMYSTQTTHTARTARTFQGNIREI